MSTSRNRRVLSLLVVSSLLVGSIVFALALGPDPAAGDEAPPSSEHLAPTAAQTREFLESGEARPLPTRSETDLHAAQTMPHRDLGRGEALELVEAVFEPELEAAGGIYDELEPERYLSDHAAVVPASSMPEEPGSTGGSPATGHSDEPLLLESSLPLRTETGSGRQEAVDLSLEHSEGELQPQNPLAEVGIPGQLGEGISLSGAEVGITLAGAPQELAPSDVEGTFAFYPEVAEDTDLIVEPTPQGVETMTDIRSAEAPTTATYDLSLPSEAALRSSPQGGAEVLQGGKATLVVPPPSATDAAGEPVPVAMQVEGEELKVTISPGPSTEFPVLVDPWYNVESWCWSSCSSPFYGWTGGSTNPSYGALWVAQWDPAHYPGLDLTSGFEGPAYVGTHADWAYWVPRYAQEVYVEHRPPPTSWVAYMRAEGVLFLPFGNFANYPAMVIGLVEPAIGWAPGAYVHYGGEGEITDWRNVEALNPPQNQAIKGADVNIVTYENEPQAKYRDTFVGSATIYVADADAPQILELKSPTGWLTGSSATIPYRFEDTGLGVHGASIRLAGEAKPHPSWGANYACTGASASPCPRLVGSAAGSAPLGFDPAELPTGRDVLEVTVADPLEGEGHVTTGSVAVYVDNSAPEISLSGPLTEQEKLGITKSEYPLAISVSDGSEDDPPQSGVASVEVKVDGKKVTMPKEELWHPACKTQDCSFTGGWTLKASEYAPGDHEVEVIATDAVGHVARETLEVELGVVPPQTSFTSPHPSYRAGEISTIAFKATRAGAPAPGATFRCSFDGSGGPPSKPCTSPFKLEGLKPGWHTFVVAAEEGGKADPTPATWKFNTGEYPQAPPAEELVYPEVGRKTASYYTLEARWGEAPEGKAAQGVTGVWFQMELPGWKEFRTVPTECTVDGQGRPVSWPLPAHSHPGHDAPVYLKVRGCPVFEAAGYPEKEIEFRAVFDGGEEVAGVSEPAATEFVSRFDANRVSTDATESVGPATVDLLTGAFTLSRTDVSIPIPGYEANLEFTRTYSSTVDKSMPAYSKVLGGAWQPASPLESEYEGEAWTRVEEKEIPEHAAVFENYCWEEWEEEEDEEGNVYRVNEHEECEPVEVEPAQPREVWIELINNEGAGVPFEIKGTELVAPVYAKELGLRWAGNNIVLAYPNGTHTTFELPEGSTLPEGKRVYLPSSISYQANANSMRMVYKTESGSKTLRLKEEVSPTPVGGAPCEENETARKTAGCRSLVFGYEPMTLGAGQTATVLKSIAYYGPNGSGVGQTVALYSYGVASLEGGELAPALTGESDPRLPVAAEKYAYAPSPNGNLLTSLTPPGQEPWSFEYGTAPPGRPVATRLKSVARAGVKTTIAYEVPVSGSGAPYEMGSESIARWGEADLPVDATAIFPPNHAPSEYPPHEYTGATVHYMDPEGHQVNVASPSPPGVTGASIATSETDVHGDVVRELDPQNRLYALEASNTVARSHELDSHSVYSANGNEQLESWGPLHKVKPKFGEAVEGRQHSVTRYDEGEPTPAAGTPWAYLPTKETVGVVVPGKEGELESRTTETKYRWDLRKPKETIVDPGGLAIRSVTEYNAAGQVTETRQPKNPGGGGAGTMQTIYYSPGASGECVSNQYANLPCKVTPAAQESGTGRPKLLVKRFTSYTNLDEPTTITESAGGEGEERVTTTIYDAAGRQRTKKITGGGTAIPKTETEYSPTLGVATGQHFVCEKTCAAATYSTSFGSFGTTAGKLDHPGDVAIDAKGDIWVADTYNNRLEEFNEKGEFLKALGSSGTGNGQFKQPKSLAFNAAGDIWVADSTNNRLQEFNEKGEFLRAVGSTGTGNGQFKDPEHLAIDAKGDVWVADTGNGRVQELNEKGEFLKVAKPAGLGGIEPTGIAVGPGGNVWVTDYAHDRVAEIDGSGETLIRQFGTAGTGNGQLEGPDAVAVDAAGYAWVIDSDNDRVEEFDQAGNYVAQFGGEGEGAGKFEFGTTTGIAVDAKGDIWVTDPENSRIEKWIAPATPFDPQTTKSEYNALGQVTEYEDADGSQTKTTYDAYGRPVTVTDARGSRTVTYDPATGLPTGLEVSGVGTFTARYDADGDLVETTMPNGISAKRTYNAAGEPMSLAYTSSCGEGCGNWFEETLERGADGRILSDTSTLAGERYSYLYSYDNAGRLTESSETPSGGNCTTRLYTYDADSNRLSKTTRPGVGAACATSGGATQLYGYDGADRLMGTGITYDAFGRIEKLPGTYAGGSELETKYFATNMVATQRQGAVTNTFQLDASGRQRQREQTGGVAGVEVFHYDDGSDSPSWTALGSTWSRNVAGMGGELAAIQESGGTTTFKLTDLHGDVVASASSNPTATKLLATYRFSEFGEPVSGGAGRFGWLGGKSRRTELASGAVQMGARSYIPQLGRFLTPDPIQGGSANAYDYANQDPINSFDLGGTCAHAREHAGRACTGQKRGHENRYYRQKATRIAHENHFRPIRGKCEFSSGCSAHISAEGAFSARQVGGSAFGDLVGEVLKIELPLLDAEHEWSAVKAAVHEFIRSTQEGTGQKLWGCAKGADDAYNELQDDAVGYVAPEVGDTYMAASCVAGTL